MEAQNDTLKQNIDELAETLHGIEYGDAQGV